MVNRKSKFQKYPKGLARSLATIGLVVAIGAYLADKVRPVDVESVERPVTENRLETAARTKSVEVKETPALESSVNELISNAPDSVKYIFSTIAKNDDAKSPQDTCAPKGVVVLDPGHGHNNTGNGIYDPGAVFEGYHEATIVLEQAKKIRTILEKKGYEVYLTREDNEKTLPLGSRLPFAKQKNANLFVSLHCNASENEDANGIEIFYEGNQSIDAAMAIYMPTLDHVKKSGRDDVRGRGVKKRALRVLDNNLPSVLVESGFLTNEKDRKYLTDSINDVEYGIAEGIDKYLSSHRN